MQLEFANPPTLGQPCCHNSLAPSDSHLISFQKRNVTIAQILHRAFRKKNGVCYTVPLIGLNKYGEIGMTAHDVD